MRAHQASTEGLLTSPGRHHAGPKVAKVEEITLQHNRAIILLPLLGEYETVVDDLFKHLLYLSRELLRQLRSVSVNRHRASWTDLL